MAAASQQPPSNQPEQKAGRRAHPVRRWIVRILLAILILLALAAITIQVVLWTSFPRSMVIGQVEKGIGLRLAVRNLATGWLGHTTLRDVRLALPISQQSFLDVRELKVRHTNLLGILLGWPVQLKYIELDDPVLYVRQNTAGRWNLQEVAELLMRVGGKQTGEQTAQTSSTPVLPALKIVDLTIVVADNHSHEARIAPVNVDGKPDSLTWHYLVDVPSHLSIDGLVAPGGTWAHRASIKVHDVGPWVREWKPEFHQETDFDGRWTGEFGEAGLHGFMEILSSRFGGYEAGGGLSAFDNSGTYAISPDNLRVHTPLAILSQVQLAGGTMSYDGKTIQATRLRLALLGGPATLGGWFQPATRQGALETTWQDLTIGKALTRSSGTLHVDYTAPLAAKMSIKGRLESRGVVPREGPFDLVADFDATGQSLDNLTWTLNAPTMDLLGGQPLVLNGLKASGALRGPLLGPRLELHTASLPSDNHLAGAGFYEFSGNRQWELHLSGQDWPIHLIEGTKLAFALDADGHGVESRTKPPKVLPYITVHKFVLQSGEAELSLNGTYDGRRPKPVKLDVDFSNTPGPALPLERPALVHGFLHGHATLEGILAPELIGISGTVDSRDATILRRSVGDMHAEVKGGIDAEKVWLSAQGIPFLDGTWGLGTTYVMKQGGQDVYATTVSMSVERLPLGRLAQFFNMRQADGMLTGSWNLYFPGLVPRANDIALTGGADIRNLAASYFQADQATFTTNLSSGVFKIDPIRLTRGGGRIDARAELNLSQWRRIQAGLQFTAWPIDIPPAMLQLQLSQGADQINVFLPDARAADPAARKLRVNTSLQLHTVASVVSPTQHTPLPVADLKATIGMRGRVVTLQAFDGTVLGGTVSGSGITDLDRPNYSQASLGWDKLQSGPLVRIFPELQGLAGTFSGTGQLLPSTDPRPLEPLALSVDFHSDRAHWRSVTIGDAQLHAYVGRSRIITGGTLPNVAQIGRGLVDFWFSSSSHVDVVPLPGGRGVQASGITVSNQVNLDLRELDIDQFVKAFDPKHTPGFGRLSGQLYLLSAPKTETLTEFAHNAAEMHPEAATPSSESIARQQGLVEGLLRTTSLDGTLTVRDSNLANYGPIAFLYNVMRLGANARTPTGTGHVDLHMEEGRLHVSNLYFFNRGIEVRGVATADQMWLLPDNPVHGSAVGTARPLKNTRFPFLSEADALLSALQGELTTVEFKGTAKDPVKDYIRLLRLTQMGAELRGLLLGQIGANRAP